MNEKKMKNKYEKRLAFQQKMITRQSEQIDALKTEIEKLKNKLIEKDEVINSVTSLRNELSQNVAEVKKYKKQYSELIKELKTMKSILNKDVFCGKWKIVRWLIKL